MAEDNFFVVGIGASAGGLQALQDFFANLDADCHAAFIVVQHLSRDFRSMMSELLQKQTRIQVSQIIDNDPIEVNRIYVLPPGKTLKIKEGKFKLTKQSESLSYPINTFFHSLAKNYKEKAIAILLSGTGNDGTEGMKKISALGGISLVQSAETAEFSSMPSSAIPFGIVDEILSPSDLAKTVTNLVHFSDNYPQYTSGDSNLIDPEKIQTILNLLAEKEHIDFSHYKINTISRRIAHRCALTRQPSLNSYINLVTDSTEEQKFLRQDLLIGATRFFRDPKAWEYLKTEVLPSLINSIPTGQQLRVWVCACSTGEEAYSMAIVIDEVLTAMKKNISVKIFATDLDTRALETASKGTYPATIRKDISTERLQKYFTSNGKEEYQVRRSLREMLIIAPHDLTKNAGFSKMTMITCRNVLIYMQPKLQQQVLRLLHFSLAVKGVLFLGNSETLADLEPEFDPIHSRYKFYSKRRDIELSLIPISRQPIVPTFEQHNKNTNLGHLRFDRMIGEVFKFCFQKQHLTCLLVNKNYQLAHIFYNQADLLKFSVGNANLNVMDIVTPQLKLPLSTALNRAKREQTSVIYTNIKLDRNEREEIVNLRVGYDPTVPWMSEHFIITFEFDNQSSSHSDNLVNIDSNTQEQLGELEYELQQTRQNLQITIEELETTNEEQQATNEELLASNEELQSTNEELQSVNEELIIHR